MFNGRSVLNVLHHTRPHHSRINALNDVILTADVKSDSSRCRLETSVAWPECVAHFKRFVCDVVIVELISTVNV